MQKTNKTKIQLVYFRGCPNVELAKNALREIAIHDFKEEQLDSLEEHDPLRRYSSPSILIDGHLVVGTEGSDLACSLIDWTHAAEKLKNLLNSK